MKVYVAGGWLDKDTLIAPMIRKLIDAGITITYDWTGDGPSVETVGKHIKHEDNLSPELRREHARRDLAGVYTADVLWLIVPEYKGSAGSWIEFGCALGHELLTVVSGPWQKSIFCELADAKFNLHEAAFDYLVRLKNQGLFSGGVIT